MYNGIGLSTTRGSATSGYVQTNVSNLQFSKNRVKYNAEEDIAKAEAGVNRLPNLELLNHEYKRSIEIKCIEFTDLLEGKGYNDDEIQTRVDEYRKLLLEEFESGMNKRMDKELDIRNTHSRAKIAKDNRDKFRSALGIDASFVDGSSLASIKKASELVKAASITENPDLVKEVDKLVQKIKKESKKRSHSASSGSSSSSSNSSSSSDSSSSSPTTSSSCGKNRKAAKRSEKNGHENSKAISKLKEPKMEPASPVSDSRNRDHRKNFSRDDRQRNHRK